MSRAYGVFDHAHGYSLPAVVLVEGPDGEDARPRLRWKHVSESVGDRPPAEDVVTKAVELRRTGSVEEGD